MVFWCQVVSYITAKILRIGKLVASRNITGENTSLLDDMHHSKMHLLKLPINLSVVLFDATPIESLADKLVGRYTVMKKIILLIVLSWKS